MLLLIDNYDSFVYNLARYFVELGCETCVVRNDAIQTDMVRAMAPQAIVISPGPCTPNEAGVSIELIRELSSTIPTLGVCLGHQAIAAALGGNVIRAPEPIHGRTSLIEHTGTSLFANLPSPLRVARYHSLIIDEATLPPDLEITAWTADGIPMAVEHRTRPLFGVQFHPESVLTEHGRDILANFARLAGIATQECSTSDWIEPSAARDEGPVPVLTW
ncbi:anthranilate synthase component II [Schlesneria paludicola]|uniref:anthranilate synthase component II n=1 Tax=Schlesneria paludicola TaxID=360056 RepID=UPI0009FDE36B